jgi:hypothetical protein
MRNTATKPSGPVLSSNGPVSPSAHSAPSPRKRERGPLYKALETVASLRITVVLFVLAFVLVFYGTWAQVDAGIWTVVNQYFRGWFVWIPLKIIFLRAFDIPDSIAIPYPGGWTLGALLLINLIAAHAVRFKLSWKRSGILILHAGIILMMIGEFITGVFAIEGRMVIMEGYASDHVDSDRKIELAIVEHLNAKEDNETIVPASLLTQGAVIRDDRLPFDIDVLAYMPNSDLRRAQSGEDNPATAGTGLKKIAVEKSETAGVDPDQAIEVTSAYLKLKKKGSGEHLGTYLVSTWFNILQRAPDTVSVDGKQYELSLRPKRSYRAYTILLKKFEHDVYPGTDKPRNYASNIKLIDPGQQENRDVKIWMNHPLRYQGETFYQSGLHNLTKGTILQVVRNPGWLLPYFSCGLVTLGMIIHFGANLVAFLRRKLA